jgi:hypothetical protein
MQDNTPREEWVEPKIDALDVEETGAASIAGRDGGVLPDELAS